MNNNHFLVILGLCAGVLIGIITAHFIWKDYLELKPQFRCLEYKGSFDPNSCTLWRRIP